MPQALTNNPLPSWAESPTKFAILDFVRRVTNVNGEDYVSPESRVAVFDNDGTLWCEKPLPVQADFLLRRIGKMADEEPSLREKQPWKAVAENDYRWLSHAITNHYTGDDSALDQMASGLMQAYAGASVEEFDIAAEDFLQSALHPTLNRSYPQCTYLPMVELLQLLSEHGFTSYIASGGGRDFMRSVTLEAYGIPPERVVGSSVTLEYNVTRRTIVHQPRLEVFDDGPEKAVRIWSRLGRKPILACGNSNGDIEMLEFTSRGGPFLDLMVLHDDALHEFSYVHGAERAIERATRLGWTVISMKNDWRNIFTFEAAA